MLINWASKINYAEEYETTVLFMINNYAYNIMILKNSDSIFRYMPRA